MKVASLPEMMKPATGGEVTGNPVGPSGVVGDSAQDKDQTKEPWETRQGGECSLNPNGPKGKT
jgi:hypothetical protein